MKQKMLLASGVGKDRMRNKKLQIYLDSDDYSKLSNPNVLAKEPHKREIRDYLLQLVERNIIEIRYSVLTISEMIHVDESAKSYAVQRAELLASLSRGKVFLPIQGIFFKEALKLISSRELPADYAYGEESNWLDYSQWNDTVDNFQISLIKGYKRAIREEAFHQ
jgi:hypothetical protein